MKLLLDTCVWGGVRLELAQAGHDVVWTGDWQQDPGDEEILAYAFREGRVVVTLDKDFGELVIVQEAAHCGVLRLVNFSARRQGLVCQHVIALHGKELESGAIITAEPGRLRLRLPENK